MALSERDRHALYDAARRELGEDAADTLMELLPPVGWADVATKQDVEAGLESLYNRVEALMYRELSREIGSVRDEIQRQTRTIIVSMVGILASSAGLALGLAQLST